MYKPNLSIIIPCYNEGPTFEDSVRKIVSVLKKTRYDWEIIFVEDKSTDDTKNSVEKLAKEIKNSSAIFHKINQGRGKAVNDGIAAAKADMCGFLDVDLEIAPSYIPLFVSEIESGTDLVVAKRFYESTSVVRFVASRIYAMIVNLVLDLPVSDSEAGFKFFRKKKITPVIAKTEDKRWFWDTEICARASIEGLKIGEIPVLFVRRPEKKSTVRLIPDSWDYLVKLFKFKSQLAAKQ